MENAKIDLSINETNDTLDDIVFQNRNHQYGAFQLRKNYLKSINQAFYIGSIIFILAMAVPTLYAKFKPKQIEPNIYLRDLEHIPSTPPTTPPVELPPPPPVEELTDVASSRLLPPEIVNNVDPAEELPPTQEEMKQAPPSDVTNIGNPDDIAPVIDETPIKKVEPVEIEPEKEPGFLPLEQQATYPGGWAEMSKFLAKNLKYPSQAAQAGIAGKVFLSFIVDRNGEILDVTVIKGIGFNCDEEALRVVKLMPRWAPGKQSGRAVKSRFNLPIAFVLE